MANNYLQFSEAIGHLSIEERDWLQRQLETVYVFGDHEYAEDEIPDNLSTADATWCGCRAFRDLPDVDSDDDAGFQYEFSEETRNSGGIFGSTPRKGAIPIGSPIWCRSSCASFGPMSPGR